MTAIRTAVVLAAGMGTRLKGHTQEQPKGFLKIGGLSLIERSLDNLRSHGVSRVIIGTGYFHEHFDALRTRYPFVETSRNTEFASTGSMYTLYGLRTLINEPFLLLESDLLYDPVALSQLIDDPMNDIILASGRTQSGDEVFIEASPEGTLVNMTKDAAKLDHISGELVGISKLTTTALSAMCSFAETAYRLDRRLMNYEDAMVGASHPLNVKVVPDLIWCEIDDESHLDRALKQIYPKIADRFKLS